MKNRTWSSSETTCYVIAYDISDNRRRTKIHDILLGYGEWTQYSLFECFLTRKQLVLLRSRLAPYLEAQEDSVRF
jgi:CRISPR-associated protein Cas2